MALLESCVLTWVYDARNIVTSSTYDGESVFSQSHDDGYRLTNQTLGNGLTRELTYGRSDNLRTQDVVKDGITAIDDLNLSYTYAVDKQITAECIAQRVFVKAFLEEEMPFRMDGVERSQTVAGGVMQNASFTANYDDGNRVTNWNRTGAIDTNSPESQSWNFDDAGNWLRSSQPMQLGRLSSEAPDFLTAIELPSQHWTSTTIDGTVQNRSHNDENELISVAGNNTIFDDRGNLTEDDQGNVYIYDLDNRLKRPKDNNAAVLNLEPVPVWYERAICL